MDSNQSTTSFIPKTRPAFSYKQTGAGKGFFAAFMVFLISAGLFAVAYFYKKKLGKEVAAAAATLEKSKREIDENLFSNLINVNNSINAAKSLSDLHQSSSKIFKLIGDKTLKDIAFANFNYKAGDLSGDSDKNTVVVMTGQATSYTSVALQARLFEQSDFVDKVAFSNFSIIKGGAISFDVQLSIKPSFISYKPEE